VRLFNPLDDLCSQREFSRGVEAVIKANNPEGSSGHADFPTTTIAISLLVGFTFMLVAEQLLPGARFHTPTSRLFSPGTSIFDFDADAELRDVGRSARTCDLHPPAIRTSTGDGSTISTSGEGFTTTLGLVLHALSHGLAIGSSVVADVSSGTFITQMIVVHKGVTAIRARHVVSFS
jgi:zinc transporter 9